MYETKKRAYQVQGVIRYLCNSLNWDYTDAHRLCENTSIETISYRYNIPDEEVNKYWYKALNS